MSRINRAQLLDQNGLEREDFEPLHIPARLLHPHRILFLKFLSLKSESDYRTIKKVLDVSDWSMWSHIRALESEKVIKIRKEIRGRKVITRYAITPRGNEVLNIFRDQVRRI